MYKKIETEFIEKSQYYNINRILIAIIVSISLLLCVLISINPEIFNSEIIVILILSVFCFIMLLLYVYILFKIKGKKKLGVKQIFQIENNISLYKKNRYEEDLLQLGIILEKYEVKTKEKLSELIKHYQSIMPKSNKSSSNFLSFTSLVISLIALFSSEYLLKNEDILNLCFLLIVLSILLYYLVWKVMSYVNIFYSENSLYEKLESMVSEIYIKEIL